MKPIEVLSFFIFVGAEGLFFSIFLLMGAEPGVLVAMTSLGCLAHGVFKWRDFWEEEWLKKGKCSYLTLGDGLAVGIVVQIFTSSLPMSIEFGVLTFFLGTIFMNSGAFIGRKINYH